MTPTHPIRVVLADDHPLVRAGMSTTLMAEPDIQVVGEATDGTMAQTLCHSLQPDVLLLDISMPGPSPLDTALFLAKHVPQSKIIIVTAHESRTYIQQLVRAGVVGYLLKEEALPVLVLAIRTVVRGGNWFSDSVLNSLLALPAAEAPLTFSEREIHLLHLLTQGMTDREMGQVLNVSERTIRYYLSRISEKLDAKSRVEAAVKAVKLGLINDSDPSAFE